MKNIVVTPKPLRVFIGYDRRETVAYHVLAHSIQVRASGPVAIAPLDLRQLQWWLRRPRDPLASTEFAYSRFMVPFLCGYEGQAIFMDCDILCRADIYKLAAEGREQDAAVSVVKHDYTPKTATKFLGQTQSAYPRKNWSSVMVFNNERCRALTPEFVNSATGAQLHRFQWCADEEIGKLTRTWNWLVGEYEFNKDAKLAHFTLGGPYFKEFETCDYADEWRVEREEMLKVIDGDN